MKELGLEKLWKDTEKCLRITCKKVKSFKRALKRHKKVSKVHLKKWRSLEKLWRDTEKCLSITCKKWKGLKKLWKDTKKCLSITCKKWRSLEKLWTFVVSLWIFTEKVAHRRYDLWSSQLASKFLVRHKIYESAIYSLPFEKKNSLILIS